MKRDQQSNWLRRSETLGKNHDVALRRAIASGREAHILWIWPFRANDAAGHKSGKWNNNG